MLVDNLNRKLPKMILFDYGHTLLYESNFDDARGYEAILAHATRNVNNLTSSEIAVISNKLFMEIGAKSRNYGIEIHDHMFQRMLFEYLDLEFSLPKEELARMFWEYAAPGTPMPNIDKVIAYLNHAGIRSGVISNISFSEYTLMDRVNRLIPNNQFEFVMASSEYVYRKPNKILFEIALKKAHLNPNEVWFCGDHPKFDILGAAEAGMFPVWYQSELECPYRKDTIDDKPECDYLHIHDWEELIDYLERLQGK